MAARDGETQRAVGYIEDVLRLELALRDELGLSPQLVRFGLGNAALRDLAETLSRCELTDEQRLRLDELLKQIAEQITLHDSVLAERATILTSLEHLSTRTFPGVGIGGILDWQERQKFIYHNFRAVQLEDQTTLLKYMAEDADLIDQMTEARSESILDRYSALQISHPSYQGCLRLAPPVGATGFSALFHRQKLTQARLALRLDRYYRREGAFPANLIDIQAELESAPLKAIPPALISGQPPAYHPSSHGFQLYDVGDDLTDDRLQTNHAGGNHRRVDSRTARHPGDRDAAWSSLPEGWSARLIEINAGLQKLSGRQGRCSRGTEFDAYRRIPASAQRPIMSVMFVLPSFAKVNLGPRITVRNRSVGLRAFL